MSTRSKLFRYKSNNLPLPLFFPDATRAFVKALDTKDIKDSKTPGILVNTFHLWNEISPEYLKKVGGIAGFMNWDGAVISDSGGFQVMSLIKNKKIKGSVTDSGVEYLDSSNQKLILTPEKSIEFQMCLKSDLLVVLDDFTDPNSDYKKAKETVDRTLSWARRCKKEYQRILEKENLKTRPYIIGVVQGGYFQDLRSMCAKELIKIGFDGLGFGGWPLTEKGDFDYESAKTISENAPKDYLLYGLGIGKPEDILGCSKLGFSIFDCVLPTRDARHGRLYVYNSDSINNIDLKDKDFYSTYNPVKKENLNSPLSVSSACDCHLCTNYSRAYLAHLYKVKEFTAGRLASIHNLRFYSILMEKINNPGLKYVSSLRNVDK